MQSLRVMIGDKSLASGVITKKVSNFSQLTLGMFWNDLFCSMVIPDHAPFSSYCTSNNINTHYNCENALWVEMCLCLWGWGGAVLYPFEVRNELGRRIEYIGTYCLAEMLPAKCKLAWAWIDGFTHHPAGMKALPVRGGNSENGNWFKKLDVMTEMFSLKPNYARRSFAFRKLILVCGVTLKMGFSFPFFGFMSTFSLKIAYLINNFGHFLFAATPVLVNRTGLLPLAWTTMAWVDNNNIS